MAHLILDIQCAMKYAEAREKAMEDAERDAKRQVNKRGR